MIQDADLVQLLPAGHSVGSIRTRRPLMYVFSGGNEDAAFFSVNGFSILLDGGDRKDVPYWNLIRNYDKISAAVVTRVSPRCLQGISAILMRKCLEECHPNFGSLICNLPPSSIANGDSEASKVLRAMHEGLRAEGLKPIEAFASAKMEAITLYEVIGEGALRMIVLNPERGSKDLISLVHALKTDENIEKFAALTSLALLLVWHPSDHTLPVSRILITGSCSLEKLYASLEKLKNEEYLRYPEFTQATKEKTSAARPGRIIRKPTPTKSASSLVRSSPLQTTTGESLKKMVRQPVAGAVPSRVSTIAKRAGVEPAKAHATNSGKSHALETKVGSRTGKSGVNDAKKNSLLEVKPKEGEIGKTNAPDKAGVRIPLAKMKAEDANSTSTDVQSTKVLKGLVTSAGLPSLDSSRATNPSHVEQSSESNTFVPCESPPMPKSPIVPQAPDDNGLLDGIEEPMKVRRISMDFSNEDKNFEEIQEAPEKGFDLLNSALPPQDTPLLDSTPMTPPSVEATTESLVSPVGSPSKERTECRNGEAEVHKQELLQKDSLQDLFGTDISPFTAGLITGIVDDAPSMQELPSEDNDELEISKSSTKSTLLNELKNGALVHDDKHDETGKATSQTSGITHEAFSARSSVSSDSVTAQPDPALDEVIDSLAEASEMVDNARKTTAELECHAQDLTAQLTDNVQPTTVTATAGFAEHLEGVKDVFDGQVTSIMHDINDNANALANQNSYEEKRAEEMYLPPMTSAARTRTKPVVNGIKIKPKLSQPLYFDIVFVPHHGAHPILKDEEAAKAFVTSVRSRRYILSGKDSIRTYFIDGLISGKTAWNKPELEVDVLPTHDSDELTLYSHEKADEMAEAGISLRCSVERCTLRLSSGGTDDVCAAFKFEM